VNGWYVEATNGTRAGKCALQIATSHPLLFFPKGSNTRAGMGGRELPLHRSVARHRLGAFAFLKGNFPIHDVEPGINRGAETSGVDAAMTARLVA
jgi:hypothetical protein